MKVKIKMLATLLLLTSMFVIVACSGDEEWSMEMSDVNKDRNGHVHMTLKILDGEEPVEGLNVSALLEMSRMDHGHIDVQFADGGNGIYAGSVELPMSGEWIAEVTLEQGDKKKSETIIFEVGEEHE
ncbi:FixH family protein [Bacillus shivajii]|uniref:FixH family protein n=1 Tax=Bacillus shivajii TaxID=1983719 RepID=UPI001CFB4F42|nr:FixH family protein [Bacillus shivajii]UCZ54053.1 FixH family protein [Bacillus shivajii]